MGKLRLEDANLTVTDIMYEGESEVDSSRYASDDSMPSAPEAGPSRSRMHRTSEDPFARKTRTKRRNLQEIMNTNPGSIFPWDEILFYVPEWLPPVIRQHILKRIGVSFDIAGHKLTTDGGW